MAVPKTLDHLLDLLRDSAGADFGIAVGDSAVTGSKTPRLLLAEINKQLRERG
ncbi:hypothetical protein [Amycolatopsis acidicola]|uniref:hypothetical protein n=1 Tax=Amycolatopsis acidicola TaxID=2596893 RepID=UPI00140B1F82|nr:hypothetical protein [Amycolatopsis acidicola]